MPLSTNTALAKRDHLDDDSGSSHDLDLAHIPPPNKIPRTDVDFSAHPQHILHENNPPNAVAQLQPQPQLNAPTSSTSSAGGATKPKKASGASTRTGQACDRCKVRKIRCDARPGGCSPCIQNNTECRTTDRITGRATSRGHTEQIENENTAMKMYIIELQQQLRDGGIQPKEAPSAQNNYGQYWGQQQQQQQQQDSHVNNGPVYPAQSQNVLAATATAASPMRDDRQTPQGGSLLPDFRSGCIGDNYLGVSSENGWLSPIEGTSLALFGTKVDLVELMPADSDPAQSGMSYRTFLLHAFGRQQVFRPELPAYEQCKVYAEWYFRSIQNFIPLLHKPDFFALIYKIYHENYQANSAELVMVHMVLTVINFQFSVRNNNEQAREDSMSHYHYACSLIPDLITGHTLADIQALTLICSQLRNQPRPGAAWMFTNLVLGLAIESGLHRSAKAWPSSGVQQDPHHLEMRKRTFWTILIFHAHLSGKLGRPMPLRLEDFDIEMPEAIPDNMPEENFNSWKQCSFRASIEGFKLLKVMMQVYSTIYSIKSTGQYETNVRHLEKELESFQAQIPPELRGGPETRDEDRVSALYLDLGVAECQLLLHHPALCRSTSPQLISGNLDVCLHWSGKLLQCAIALKGLNALDTTWYSTTNFLAAIFTTLFAHTERRDQMTTTDLQRLKQDMDSWLEILAEVATLLGKYHHVVLTIHPLTSHPGLSSNLQSAIRPIIDFSLSNIQRHIAAKTAAAALPATSSPGETHAQAYTNGNGYNEQYSGEHSSNGEVHGNHGQAYVSPHDEQNHGYQATAQYAYPAPHESHVYPPGGLNGYNTTSYADDTKPNLEEQLMRVNSLADQQAAEAAASRVGPHSAPTNFLAAFQSPTTQPSNGFDQTPPTAGINEQVGTYPQAGPVAWRHFADTIMPNDYMGHAGHSTASLLALSGGKAADGTNGNMVAAAQMGSLQLPVSDGAQAPWPLLHYSSGNEGH